MIASFVLLSFRLQIAGDALRAFPLHAGSPTDNAANKDSMRNNEISQTD